MRSNYPLNSEELNDKLQIHYENLVYLNGVDIGSGVIPGLYDRIVASGLALLNNSGIPYIPSDDNGISNPSSAPQFILTALKFDYIYKKLSGEL